MNTLLLAKPAVDRFYGLSRSKFTADINKSGYWRFFAKSPMIFFLPRLKITNEEG